MVETVVPYAMAAEPPLSFRCAAFDYDHEVLISLPASYPVSPDRRYPVLWAMDGAMQHAFIAGLVNMYTMGQRLPEMIVISVGHSSAQGMAGVMKRTADLFAPGQNISGDALAEKVASQQMGGTSMTDVLSQVKGDKFLDFLIDELRPTLAQKYRMSDDHALMGHSAGGAFTGYAVFARPGAFRRFLIGSGTGTLTMELEERYAAEHDDLAARIFIAAGAGEANNLGMSYQRIVSRTVLLAENLRLRQYPSLELKSQLYTDRDHFTVMPPLFADGLQHIYADEAAKLPAMPW